MEEFFIPIPTPPRNLVGPELDKFDLQVDDLLQAPLARTRFKVDGAGLAVAVLDTGLRVSHKCFTGRVIAVRNFTDDDGGKADVVTDNNGHGTNVTGIIAAGTNDERRGIAPGASIVAVKVLSGAGAQFSVIQRALTWLYENANARKISVVNLSLGDPKINFTKDADAAQRLPELAATLRKLADMRVAVVAAAGNSYFQFQAEGMSVPAIFRQVISVGAVYDAAVGGRSYSDGAVANSTHADQITPFSQRLSKERSPDCYTDIFSAGGGITSAGKNDDDDSSTQDGTSQAAPTISGVVLLLQEYYLRIKRELPPIELLQDALRSTSTRITDGDDEDDNVVNTNRKFPRANALESLAALHKMMRRA